MFVTAGAELINVNTKKSRRRKLFDDEEPTAAEEPTVAKKRCLGTTAVYYRTYLLHFANV